ncbi:MAG: hypothetical protein JNK67_18900 [Alphaproteobacteria bacterium]|nr:hypothetical protein [Alphaproteobacteria bacterium]
MSASRPILVALLPLIGLAAPSPARGNEVAQASSGARTRLTCDIQRAQRLGFIDNPLAPAGINRRITAGDEASSGRFELVFSANGADATLTIGAQIRDGGKPGSARMSRYAASEYTGFTGFDPEDGSTYLVTYFARINKAIWTIHTPRLEGRERAASARSLFAECRREEQR